MAAADIPAATQVGGAQLEIKVKNSDNYSKNIKDRAYTGILGLFKPK
jgi:hypothetical protein